MHLFYSFTNTQYPFCFPTKPIEKNVPDTRQKSGSVIFILSAFDIYFTTLDIYFSALDIYFSALDIYFSPLDIYFSPLDIYFSAIDIPGAANAASATENQD